MKLNEYPTAKRLFTNYFDLRLSDFYDWELTFIFGSVQINIIAFDDWLHRQHGEYETEGYTMRTLVIERYSTEAWKLLDELTNV